MTKNETLFDFFYSRLLSGKIKEKSEVIIISVAIGVLNTIMVVVAVLFGVLILLIHNQYEKMSFSND